MHMRTRMTRRSMASVYLQVPRSSGAGVCVYRRSRIVDAEQVYTAKTEILWCATNRRQHLIPQTQTRIGDDYITPAASVRDLGIYIDSDVSMKSHVSRTCVYLFRSLATDP